ncbi:MAG: tyrosine-type recombinase/integrase [Vulcanimicrobiaceae bacterium]
MPRHTAGTWLLSSGVDARTAATILGHTTPSTTLAVYGHTLPGSLGPAIERIATRLSDHRTA